MTRLCAAVLLAAAACDSHGAVIEARYVAGSFAGSGSAGSGVSYFDGNVQAYSASSSGSTSGGLGSASLSLTSSISRLTDRTTVRFTGTANASRPAPDSFDSPNLSVQTGRWSTPVGGGSPSLVSDPIVLRVEGGPTDEFAAAVTGAGVTFTTAGGLPVGATITPGDYRVTLSFGVNSIPSGSTSTSSGLDWTLTLTAVPAPGTAFLLLTPLTRRRRREGAQGPLGGSAAARPAHASAPA